MISGYAKGNNEKKKTMKDIMPAEYTGFSSLKGSSKWSKKSNVTTVI